jgi:hypothetical protein
MLNAHAARGATMAHCAGLPLPLHPLLWRHCLPIHALLLLPLLSLSASWR